MARPTRKPVEKEPEIHLPLWLGAIIRTAGIITPFLLIPGVILLLGMFGLLLLGKVEFPILLAAISWMSFLLIMGYICLLLSKFTSPVPGWFGVIAGFALYYSVPFLIPYITQINGLANQIRGASAAVAAASSAVNNVTSALHAMVIFLKQFLESLQNIGVTLAVLSIIDLIAVYTLLIIRRRGQTRFHTIKYLDLTGKDALKRDFIPKCWQMSRCRPVIRVVCPNYIDRKTCWKRRGGCFCHRELVNYLKDAVEIRNKSGESMAAMQEMKRSMKQVSDRLKNNKPSWRDQKERCFSCPLYDEHQEYKYRNLSWISLPVSFALVFALFYPFDLGYKIVMTYVDQLVQKLPYVTESYNLANSAFEWVMLGTLSLILLTYVISLTEVVLLKWKL